MLYSHEPHLHMCSFPSRNMHYICVFAFQNEVGGGKHFPFSPLCSDRFLFKGRNGAGPRLSSFALGVPWEPLLSTHPPATPFSKRRKRWKQSTPWEQVGCQGGWELPAPPKKGGNCGLYGLGASQFHHMPFRLTMVHMIGSCSRPYVDIFKVI